MRINPFTFVYWLFSLWPFRKDFEGDPLKFSTAWAVAKIFATNDGGRK